MLQHTLDADARQIVPSLQAGAQVPCQMSRWMLHRLALSAGVQGVYEGAYEGVCIFCSAPASYPDIRIVTDIWQPPSTRWVFRTAWFTTVLPALLARLLDLARATPSAQPLKLDSALQHVSCLAAVC